MTFIHTLCVNGGKSKQDKQNHDAIPFEYAIYRVLHERSNIAAPFAEHLKFQEKETFAKVFWVKCGKIKQEK